MSVCLMIFFCALLEKKDKQFSTTAVSLYSVRLIYKRLKNVCTLSGLWWEDAGKK